MAQDRFLIAPIKEGLRTDLKPWLLPESAFARLNNVYMKEGSLRKRFGSSFTGTGYTNAIQESLFSRLRIALSGAGVGITDASGDATGTVPGAIFKIGQMFSIGDDLFTVYQTGTPADMLNTGAATVATFNTTTGAYVFTGAPALTQIYFYPCEPVMGLANYESNAINNNPSIAFDTQFAYKFSAGAWGHIGPTGTYFEGDNADFFSTHNWHGLTNDLNMLFITNFNATVPVSATDDFMWRYDNSAWTVFSPIFKVAGNFVKSAKLIIPFKDRLLLLNTVENDASGGLGVNTAYQNRCRFSHNGSPLAASAFYEPNEVGYTGGGWIDATTKEEIISAEFIKDRLIVFFERSTWELAYTGNNVQPFLWQKINTELGSESTFSSVPFDKAILTVGTTGIHACNGANVERIDQQIEDQIFEIRNDNNGPIRVAGVRDYYTELVYWSVPMVSSEYYSTIYPNKVLVYNYKDGVWALNDDSITCFGFFEQSLGKTWATMMEAWEDVSTTWMSGRIQPQFRTLIGGNQHGFVFNVDSTINNNERLLQITNMTAIDDFTVSLSIRDHNLAQGDYIKIDDCQGDTGFNGNIYSVNVTGQHTVEIDYDNFADNYTGGGLAARVSQIDILTKRYNPYIDKGLNVSIDSIDFAVRRTTYGQLTVDYYSSASDVSMVDSGIISGSILGTNILETSPYALVPFEYSQDVLWHKVYCASDGNGIQLRIYMSDSQMLDPLIATSDFELEGFILNVTPKGRLN